MHTTLFSRLESNHSHFFLFFFLMIRRPPRSTLFPLHDALPILIGAADDSARRGSKAILTGVLPATGSDRKSTHLNSSHTVISYAVFCLKKKKKIVHANAHKNKNTQNTLHQQAQPRT